MAGDTIALATSLAALTTFTIKSMNCPVCKSSELSATQLEANLTSQQCPTCRGNWIPGAQYWDWVEEHKSHLAERVLEHETLSLAEPGLPIDCPECRFRMVKYLVGRGLSFSLDHCQGCKGIWLDRNEWEALKKRNLHDDLNTMFTSAGSARTIIQRLSGFAGGLIPRRTRRN